MKPTSAEARGRACGSRRWSSDRGRAAEDNLSTVFTYIKYIYIYIYIYTYTYTYTYIHRYTDTYTYASRFARRATIDVDAIRVEKVLCSQHSWGLGTGWKVIPVTRSALRCYFKPVLAPKFAEAARKLRGSRIFSCPPPAHADGYQRLLDHRLSPFLSALASWILRQASCLGTTRSWSRQREQCYSQIPRPKDKKSRLHAEPKANLFAKLLCQKSFPAARCCKETPPEPESSTSSSSSASSSPLSDEESAWLPNACCCQRKNVWVPGCTNKPNITHYSPQSKSINFHQC